MEDGSETLCSPGRVDEGDVDLRGRRDAQGRREGKVGSEPETITAWLSGQVYTSRALVSCLAALAPALYDGLAAAGLPVVCMDARHLKAAAGPMPVKTDRIDARNIAWALQAGWCREVHVKSRGTHEQGDRSKGRGIPARDLL